MKETLFEILLNLFETTLLRLKEANESQNSQNSLAEQILNSTQRNEKVPHEVFQLYCVKDASPNAIRVFTTEEQRKLTKASYQFLMRLKSWGVISSEVMELVINLLLRSSSSTVSLRETKWTIRSLIADKLSFDQLAYLDLVLYHTEDAIVQH